jgi:hypothetical protein
MLVDAPMALGTAAAVLVLLGIKGLQLLHGDDVL